MQYVCVLTPLLLLLGCAMGNVLLCVVTGCLVLATGYGVCSVLLLVYSILYWMKDNSSEEQMGSCGHVSSLSLLGGVMLVVVAEASLFLSILYDQHVDSIHISHPSHAT
jgi:hypothetical protein